MNKLSLDFITRQASQSNPEIISGLFPSANEWEEALLPLLEVSPPPALVITSPLGGALHLIEASSTHRNSTLTLPRDAEGQCSALRVIRYVANLLQNLPITSLTESRRADTARLFCLSLIIANDNLSVSGANHLWSQYSPEMDAEMATLVSSMQSIVHSWVEELKDGYSQQTLSDSLQSFLSATLVMLWINSKGRGPQARTNAEAYGTLMSDIVETHGPQPKESESLARKAIDLRKEGEIMQLAALLYGRSADLSLTVVGKRWCSELVADLTGLELNNKPDDAVFKLTLLNLLFGNISSGAKDIAKQRTVFFMRHVLPWLQIASSAKIQAETLNTLLHIVPNIIDLYGDHWSQMLAAIARCWSDAPKLDPTRPESHTSLPELYYGLRLYNTLKAAAKAETEDEEPNDDLVEALAESQQPLVEGLFNLLSLSYQSSDEYNQPLRMINELTTRAIRDVPSEICPSSDVIYPLLSTTSDVVQQIAYEVLHNKIPSMQEQLSLDAALENRKVKLPEELLSLVLEAPNAQDLEDTPWERIIPLSLRSYLLSWLLVFDHFNYSSYRLKSDYLDSLKELSPLPALLDFTFDFLGHRRGRPIDASKFDITKYDPSDVSGDPKRDCQQLLSHIYFLALQNVPGLVKAWWIDLRARALVSSIESWTEKHVSPHIISAALITVSQWATEQSDPNNPNAASESEQLKIAVNQRANEIRASYDVDEQTMSITIKIPGAWPLLQASVIGTSRVGVDEKKWQSWVRGCQGVITFSNNNLIDGLLAFRRNVVGAMKGQTECAICYSVISADKQLPSKRCGTCKNLFHSGCLYRWFKTSNASTCPLCRNPFNYG